MALVETVHSVVEVEVKTPLSSSMKALLTAPELNGIIYKPELVYESERKDITAYLLHVQPEAGDPYTVISYDINIDWTSPTANDSIDDLIVAAGEIDRRLFGEDKTNDQLKDEFKGKGMYSVFANSQGDITRMINIGHVVDSVGKFPKRVTKVLSGTFFQNESNGLGMLTRMAKFIGVTSFVTVPTATQALLNVNESNLKGK